MLFQTERHLNPTKIWGCYALTLGAMAEKVTGRSKNCLEILEILHRAYFLPTKDGRNYLTLWIEKSFLSDLPDIEVLTPPEPVLDLWGLSYKFLGVKEPDYVLGPGEEVIYEFYNRPMNNTHFVLGSAEGRILYDSMEKSRTVAEGFLKSKRVYGPR